MKRLAAVAAALAAVAAALALLQVRMDADRRGGLSVRAHRAGSLLTGPVRLEPRGEGELRARVDGAPAPGAALVLDPAKVGPGLHVVQYERPHLGRPPRTVTFAWLAGPFAPAEAPVACSVRVGVGPALLDALARRLERAVTRELKGALSGVPDPDDVTVRLEPVPAGLEVHLDLGFADGSRLRLAVPLKAAADRGRALTLTRRGPVEAEATGLLGGLAMLQGGGLGAALESLLSRPEAGLSGALEAAREAGRAEAARRAAAEVDPVLAGLDRRLAEALPTRLEAHALGAAWTAELVPCGDAQGLPGRGLVLRYGARITTPHRSAAAPTGGPPGPPLSAADTVPVAGPLGPGLTLSLSEGLVRQAADALWRSGLLADALTRAATARAGDPRLSALRGVRVSAVAPRLPPQVRLEAGRLALVLPELSVHLSGGDRDRELSLLARASVEAEVEGGAVRVRARPEDVLGSCREVGAEGEIRRPCLAELIDALSAGLARSADLSIRLPAAKRAGGGRLRLTEVRAGPGVLVLGGDLELGPELAAAGRPQSPALSAVRGIPIR